MTTCADRAPAQDRTVAAGELVAPAGVDGVTIRVPRVATLDEPPRLTASRTGARCGR